MTYDTFLQGVFCTEQTVTLLHLYLTQWNARLLGHHCLEVVALQLRSLVLGKFFQFVEDALEAVDALLHGGNLGEVDVAVELCHQDAVGLVVNLVVEPFQVFHHHGVLLVLALCLGFHLVELLAIRLDVVLCHVVHRLEERHGAVDEVDGGSGQCLLREVSLGEADGVLHHFLVDGEFVVSLVFGHDALEDSQTLVGGRLVDDDALHSAAELLVGLQVLGVAVGGTGADEQQVALGEFLLQDGGGTEEIVLAVEELLYRFDDEDGILLLLYLADHFLDAVVYLALVGGTCREGCGVQFVCLGILQERGHVVGGQLVEEPVDERCLADARLAGNEQVCLGLPSQNLVDGGDFLLESHHGFLLAATYLGYLVDAVFSDVALLLGHGVVEVGVAHVCRGGGTTVVARLHLGADFCGGERQGLQLVEGEAHARCHQGCEHAYRLALLQTETLGEIVGFLHHGDGLVGETHVGVGTRGAWLEGHLYVSPVLEVIVVLAQFRFEEVDEPYLLVEHCLEQVGGIDGIVAIFLCEGACYGFQFIYHSSVFFNL